MSLSDFDYQLPAGLIAKYPGEIRDRSRLLVVHTDGDFTEDRHFRDIIDYINPGDCLVLNDSKVLPARLNGVKASGSDESSGAKVEILLIRRVEGDIWEVMVRPGKKLRPGDCAIFKHGGHEIRAEITDFTNEGTRMARLLYEGDFIENLNAVGNMPIPPYLKRDAEEIDKTRYQTVYSQVWGSVAAPTAGLHFTEELINRLKMGGVSVASVTLHVGPGTFLPVKTENIDEHHMHFEEYSISAESAELINSCRSKGGRVICAGTTSVRAIESAARRDDETACFTVNAGHGNTDIFIRPGYAFKVTDDLITNFHLPKSTLLMLVSALYDRDKMLAVYEKAVQKGYRFFSYGDAMFITGRKN